MKKIVFFAAFLLLVGCSSADLSLSDLKEQYPEAVAAPLEALSQRAQSQIGLPRELPFEASSIKVRNKEDTVEVLYEAEPSAHLLVRTVYQPGNILKDSELQIPLNSGAVAGVQEQNEVVYVEWYNSDDDVIYQIEYKSTNKETRTEQAIDIANAI